MSVTHRLAGAAALLSTALVLSAHFVWVDTMPAALEKGKTTKVRVGNGHDLAESESPIGLDGTKMVAIAPGGGKTPLTPSVDGKWVTASYAVKESGVHRFVLTQDRGVLSQTTKGYKPGGRDVHPDAKKSMKIWRSASGVAWTSDAKFTGMVALGMPFEMIATASADGITLTVIKNGRPQPKALIARGLPGKDDDEELGTTNDKGQFFYKFPAGFKGPIAFIATVSEPAPKAANYETDNFAATLQLSW